MYSNKNITFIFTLFLCISPCAFSMQENISTHNSQGNEVYSEAPLPLIAINPKFPKGVTKGAVSGYVTLKFTISTFGAVVNPVVIKSNLPENFHLSAIQALSKWKFKPKVENGGVVVQKNMIKTINFN